MIVLAGSASGLVRGERAGGTWEVERVIEGFDVRALAADETALYAGTDASGVWYSDDGGRTWKQVGLEDQRIRSLAAAHGRVYAGTKPARVWVSPSGGGGWEPLAPFPRWRSWYWWSPAERPHTAYVQALCASPTDPQVVLAGIEAGALVRSVDGGRSWSGHLRRASRDPHAVSFHPSNGAWAYEGGGTGAAITRDGGASWQKVSAGLDRRYCWAVAADPEQPERWYVAAARGPRQAHGEGHAGARLCRAEGDRWTIVADDLPAMPYLLTCPAPDHVVAVLAGGEVRVTTDAGDSWQTVPITLGRIRTALVLT
jgi:photosystem II stability/assembly factor-like uncharacterized protein